MSFFQFFESKLRTEWQSVFSQQRTLDRVVEHATALSLLQYSRTIANTIVVRGRDQQDWSAEYKVFSRSEWEPEKLMDPSFEYCIRNCDQAFLTVAIDDTKIRKTGKSIPGTSYQRDPMSPPFCNNIILASRYLHAAAVVQPSPDSGARTLPICFRETPVVKRPGKRATPQQVSDWKILRKSKNLSTSALDMVMDMRQRCDRLGGMDLNLLLAVDGSFCNKVMFSNPIDRVHLLARCRKDAKLAHPSREPGRVYDPIKFTPEQIRKDESIEWSTMRIHYGGDWREIRCKEINRVLWQHGAKRRLLRVIVVAARPYRTSPNGKVNYRSEAYYLSTDLESPLQQLVQAAFDRWQIEVNHREQKTGFGVGEAQVRSKQSVPRHPAFVVAVYSLLHLSAIEKYGPHRGEQYCVLPKWRGRAKRPSINDLKRLLQSETQNHSPGRKTPSTSSRKSRLNAALAV